jgi:2-dehydro-3-deoxyphosphogluconate aldolase/(4S)-4-hydroxy-2-oxoglutarate aldolase
LSCLDEVGLRHVEIGWQPDGRWCSFVARVRQRCPSLQLGAASLLTADALADLETCGLPFAMSPCLDPALLERARQRGILLVPGVFSPSEIQQASAMGCGLVKLFPAFSVGVDYIQRLRAPLGPLPQVIAAGGLRVTDVDPWLKAGHAAVALGRRVIDVQGPDPALLRWLQTVSG